MKEIIHILVTDDDPDIRQLLRILLEDQGYRVSEASSGAQALEILQQELSCDLVILDVMMPGLDGIRACKAIRKFSTVPILFLTAKTQLEDMAQAYGSGGDDFLSKPFSPGTLIMKVESLLRRYRTYKGKQEGYCDLPFRLDEDRRGVIKNGEPVELTAKEYEILRYLFFRRGRVVSVREIYEDIWGECWMAASTNTIMVHVTNLRKKLEENPASPKYIKTIWGKGYQFG